MSTHVTSSLKLSLQELASKAIVPFIAIEDSANLPIVYVHEAKGELKRLLGYRKKSLLGEQFEQLLPVRIRERHRGFMEAFKRETEASTSRPMREGGRFPAINANGLEVQVLVDISYHEPKTLGTHGIFLAFLQDPGRSQLTPDQLAGLKVKFEEILVTPKKLITNAWISALKWGTGVGAGGVALFFFTFTAQGVAAVKALQTVFGNKAATVQGQDFGIVRTVDRKTREENMNYLKNVFQVEFPDQVFGIAYFQILGANRRYLAYAGDTGGISPDTQELFFWDSQSGKNKILLSGEQSMSLFRNFDCIYIKEGGVLPDKNNESFPTVICPLSHVLPDEAGKDRFVSNSVAAIAIQPNIDPKFAVETLGGLLHQYSPAIESINGD